jgi:hypothetical protein
MQLDMPVLQLESLVSFDDQRLLPKEKTQHDECTPLNDRQ